MPVTLKAWGHLKSLLKIYLLGIGFFTFYRLLIVFTNLQQWSQIHEGKWWMLLRAMVMGWRFDTVISCYILALPVVLVSIAFMAGILKKWLLNFLYGLIALLYVLSFFICSVDVPFFKYFFNRLNDTIFNWMGSAGFGFRMVIEEPGFWIFFLVFLTVAAAYLFFLRKILIEHKQYISRQQESLSRRSLLKILPFTLLLWGMTFLGIRGRTAEKSPIIAGTAFFSNNPFINQLGLNPVFSLMRSTLDGLQPENSHFKKLSEADALKTSARLFGGDPSLQHISPIARWQQSEAPLAGRNLVLVIMESMTTAKMGRFQNPDHLTPFLDSLAAQNWSFDSIYSAGMHTYNGIYSTLFAHPALMQRHTMDHVNVPVMAGFSNLLSKQGYQTIFFTTHDELFDNMSGFLSANDFQKIVGQKDYPAEEVKSTLGVPDEYMFHFSISHLNHLSAEGKPFFAAFMTGSDHDPMVIPTERGYVRRHEEDDKAVVAYADWSLRRFIEYASHESWYANTVFVFVADHGKIMGNNAYDVVFSNHHIPFIIFAPGYTQSRTLTHLGTQSDVFPTVTSLLLPRFINNTFGINLLQQHHRYIVFSADDKLACMDDSLLYIYRTQAASGLYHYRQNDPTDYSAQMPEAAQAMQHAAFSWLQTSDWMLAHGKTAVYRK